MNILAQRPFPQSNRSTGSGACTDSSWSFRAHHQNSIAHEVMRGYRQIDRCGRPFQHSACSIETRAVARADKSAEHAWTECCVIGRPQLGNTAQVRADCSQHHDVCATRTRRVGHIRRLFGIRGVWILQLAPQAGQLRNHSRTAADDPDRCTTPQDLYACAVRDLGEVDLRRPASDPGLRCRLPRGKKRHGRVRGANDSQCRGRSDEEVSTRRIDWRSRHAVSAAIAPGNPAAS